MKSSGTLKIFTVMTKKAEITLSRQNLDAKFQSRQCLLHRKAVHREVQQMYYHEGNNREGYEV
jgi:hypothetical protein